MIRSVIFSLFIIFTSLNSVWMTTSHAAETKTVVLDVPGMTCKFCPITIRKALGKVPGVIKATADFDTKTATVTFDPAKTNIKALTEATKNAGYKSTLKK